MTSSAPGICNLALYSARRYCHLVASHTLHLRGDRLGSRFTIDGRGTYTVFRETVCDTRTDQADAVLVVGFRLRLLKRHAALHWLFQRVCILTTPFWSGVNGFRVKLWMVDPITDDYLGIYQWSGEANARRYVDALIRVLCPLSVPGSVWYALYPDLDLGRYLRMRQAHVPVGIETGVATHMTA